MTDLTPDPTISGQLISEFSVGWLADFKKYYKLQQQNRHEEASSVPESAAEEMKFIQSLCEEYLKKDIYNMNETGLFDNNLSPLDWQQKINLMLKEIKAGFSSLCQLYRLRSVSSLDTWADKDSSFSSWS